jgi:hypothetical protein
VAADGHEVNIKLFDISGNLADGLGRVGVEEYFLVSSDLSYFLDWMNHTDFVVDHY